ncbi:MAG: ATP-dependent DNA helicase, partial [Nanoarchaeota archaeon]
AYEKIKTLKNYQDYSDLNKNALKLLQENREISENYDYIIVDEFQDTNKIQLDLLVLLAKEKDITIVGDLNQSIYRFRGAYNKNFLEFKNKFNVSNTDIFNLDKSYRSSNKILKAAHNLILNNYSIPSECFEVMNFENRQGDNVEVYELKNAREEARRIVELIEETLTKGVEARDICVMFRTHQQGRIIRRALDVKKLPYISVTKSSLLKEKSVRAVINYLTILDKLKNKEKGGEQAWWDLIYHLNLEEEDLIKFGRYIKDNRKSDNLSALILSSISELKFSEKGQMAVKILLKRINMMLESSNKEIKELITDIYNIAGLVNSNKTKEEKIITMNLNKFYELAKNHSVIHTNDLNGFIYYLDILSSLGIEIESAESEDDGIRLMTLHATKGLEYNTVIITNLCQKRFPIERISNSLIPLELSPEFNSKNSLKLDEYALYEYERQNQLFEERRLCYVAFTRAKERLILTYAREYGGRKYYPSQFLHEIKYKENSDLTFSLDLDEKYHEINSEIKRSIDFSDALNNKDFNGLITNMAKNHNNEQSSKDLVLSPSSLLAFINCQKKYEYKYVYNMPEQKTISWEAIMLGSFVHLVLELGVKANYKEFKQFEDIARELHLEKEWEGINVDEALVLIKVFFERNKKKYSANSKTEQKLNAEIGGVKFIGFADRIDYSDQGLEIIDYKTGKSTVPPLERSWQLGYYAIAASRYGTVKRITLDMLRHDTPLEFELDDKGNAIPVNSSRLDGFNIYNVEQQLIKTAHEIISAYKNGFKPCSIEKNCEFCNEYVWGL